MDDGDPHAARKLIDGSAADFIETVIPDLSAGDS